ncbi:MerR family transcriptional regulator [Halobacteriovorax sp. JY17]|uniref:MerR family transcriptional regulator n=1 Tax=Halobacteriovorax sp. JY17 TaxID=2014617 RepID=UPI000C6B86B0|nr:MerR family transcriptional regulator [Halobacteriovorax sp. JY17]PIK15292.1 MAG: MerR family transcriptional regulator [Halobacteriovorax sp. JY17]
MSNQIEIPNKSHFKLNEVCSLTGVKPYVLRFWESEFDHISPVLSSSGQKLFEHKDIEAIAFIKKLLFEDKMSIEQARAELDLKLISTETEVLIETEDHSVEKVSRERFTRNLSDSDIQKLVMAKAKLSSLISSVDSIKQRNNWH